MKKILSSLLVGGILMANQLPINNIETIHIDNDKFEPSGLTLHQDRLLSVSDNGIIFEKNREGQSTTKIKKKDYEGITFNNDGSRLFLVEEGKDNIIEISTKAPFDKLNKFDIDRKFNGKKVIHKKGNGLESLTFVKETSSKIYFYTANQSKKFKGKDKSAILFVEVDKNTNEGKIIEYFPMKIKDISAMLYKNDNEIYFTSDKQNTLFLTDKNFSSIKEFELPGKDQEGLAIDFKKNIMYIAQDTGDILKVNLNGAIK